MAFGSLIQDERQERKIKSLFLSAVISVFLFLLITRLFYLQVILAELNLRLSNENAMREKLLIPPRGQILDRNGVVLARNRPSYSICVLPYKVRDKKKTINSLCMIKDSLGDAVFDSTDLEKIFKKALIRRFELTRLKEDVSLDLVSIIEEHSMEIPGVIVETESRREYTFGSSAFHVLGYMSEIPENDFDSLKELGYYYGDKIGKAGIEKQYERIFRGKYGKEYVEVNAYGKSLGPIPNIPRIDPVPGNDLYLTIDAQLQMIAELAFPDSLKGAIVALDPRNGEVLVMYSSPSVDPNIFSLSSSLRSQNWGEIATDPNLPLNNRAINGTYTPGSTFKIISALAGLESGKIERNTYMPTSCRGGYRIGSRVAHCWKLTGHGPMNLVGAIGQSCNVYFYQVGLRLGDQLINKHAYMLGLGELTGIDLPGEKTGWLSGEEAYNKRFARRGWKWTTGLVLDLAIGQTQIVTPIQLALMVGGVTNGKTLYKPYLVKEERTASGAVVNQRFPEAKSRLNLNESSVATIREALGGVVRPGGTGGRAAVPGIVVGGKTGSAENPHGDKTHALVVACAPVENPVIAVAVVVENAGGGGAVAAPIAGDIMRYFFAETADGIKTVQELAVDSVSVRRLNASVSKYKEILAGQQ